MERSQDNGRTWQRMADTRMIVNTCASFLDANTVATVGGQDNLGGGWGQCNVLRILDLGQYFKFGDNLIW